MLDIKNGEAKIEGILRESGSYISVIRGRSMWPLLKTDRDAVVLVSAERASLAKYDVALYRVRDKYILHRVVGIDTEKEIYLIRGDNTYELEYVPFDAILARMVAYNRRGKHRKVTDRAYRAYTSLWQGIYPLRYAFVRVRRALGKIKRRLLGRSK